MYTRSFIIKFAKIHKTIEDRTMGGLGRSEMKKKCHIRVQHEIFYKLVYSTYKYKQV